MSALTRCSPKMEDYSVKPWFICKKCGLEVEAKEDDIREMKKDKVHYPGCPFCDRRGPMKLVYRETIEKTECEGDGRRDEHGAPANRRAS